MNGLIIGGAVALYYGHKFLASAVRSGIYGQPRQWDGSTCGPEEPPAQDLSLAAVEDRVLKAVAFLQREGKWSWGHRAEKAVRNALAVIGPQARAADLYIYASVADDWLCGKRYVAEQAADASVKERRERGEHYQRLQLAGIPWIDWMNMPESAKQEWRDRWAGKGQQPVPDWNI